MRKHSQRAGDHKSLAVPKEHLSSCLRSKAWVLLTMGWWSTAGAGPAAVQGLAFCVEKTSCTEKTPQHTWDIERFPLLDDHSVIPSCLQSCQLGSSSVSPHLPCFKAFSLLPSQEAGPCHLPPVGPPACLSAHGGAGPPGHLPPQQPLKCHEWGHDMGNHFSGRHLLGVTADGGWTETER